MEIFHILIDRIVYFFFRLLTDLCESKAFCADHKSQDGKSITPSYLGGW